MISCYFVKLFKLILATNIILALFATSGQLGINGRSQDIPVKENKAYQSRTAVTRRESTQSGDEEGYYETIHTVKKDGYTNPMQMQEVLVDTRDVDAATQPTVILNPSYINPPSRADLESDGYSDPRY